jgi:hypothetical protein
MLAPPDLKGSSPAECYSSAETASGSAASPYRPVDEGASTPEATPGLYAAGDVGALTLNICLAKSAH